MPGEISGVSRDKEACWRKRMEQPATERSEVSVQASEGKHSRPPDGAPEQQCFISEFFLEASWVDSKLGLKYKPDNSPKVDYEQSKFKVGAMYMEGDETKTKFVCDGSAARRYLCYWRGVPWSDSQLRRALNY
eukprot:g42234.t1